MTGFGRATLSLPNHLVTLEVFSVNKKGLEIVFPLPRNGRLSNGRPIPLSRNQWKGAE